ncbi:hypothetical protein D3C71_1857810 [compost metagenome]
MRPRRTEVWRKPSYRDFHDPRPGHRGTDDKCAPHDDDDVVGQPGERLLWHHNACGDGRQKRTDRNEIVSPPPPYECDHHEEDDAEGENLLGGHRMGSVGLEQRLSLRLVEYVRTYFFGG